MCVIHLSQTVLRALSSRVVSLVPGKSACLNYSCNFRWQSGRWRHVFGVCQVHGNRLSICLSHWLCILYTVLCCSHCLTGPSWVVLCFLARFILQALFGFWERILCVTPRLPGVRCSSWQGICICYFSLFSATGFVMTFPLNHPSNRLSQAGFSIAIILITVPLFSLRAMN